MINIRTPAEIKKIAASGSILAEVMKKIIPGIREGTKLSDLDKLTESLIRKAGAKPAFLNYRPAGARKPYAASICTSLNEVIVHGFPNDYKLKSGDVLKLDFGVLYKGFYADAAITILIGEVSAIARRLTEATREALSRAIKKCEPGSTLGDVGLEIENTAKKYGFKSIKGLTGHGIGTKLHEEPEILNYGQKGKGLKLKPGMVLALEPMFSAGTDEIVQQSDDSWATADNGLSAHFEHTVAITEKGPQILTAF
jgi:methionyl aminopeptidase